MFSSTIYELNLTAYLYSDVQSTNLTIFLNNQILNTYTFSDNSILHPISLTFLTDQVPNELCFYGLTTFNSGVENPMKGIMLDNLTLIEKNSSNTTTTSNSTNTTLQILQEISVEISVQEMDGMIIFTTDLYVDDPSIREEIKNSFRLIVDGKDLS